MLVHQDIERVLLDEEVIKHRVEELAAEMLAKEDGRPLVLGILMKGGLVFATDLFRCLPVRLEIECLNVSSYHGGTESSGEVRFDLEPLEGHEGKRLILVDDIFDTGLTMETLKRACLELGVGTVESCVLLKKKKEREVAVNPEYVGFTIADEFVVGYGLDYAEKYRNLPYIGVLKSEVYTCCE